MGPPKGNLGATHRGLNDASGPNFAEPSLDSTATIQQLLAIARGDFSSVATADGLNTAPNGAGGSAKGWTADGSEHALGAFTGSFSPFTNASRSASGGGETRLTAVTIAAGPASPCSTSPPAFLLSRTASTGNGVGAWSAMPDSFGDGGDTSTFTKAEVGAFYLTAFVAQALHLEDYWVHLGHQIEVDQHVEFIQYCAREGFGAPKTMHLLSWWRQYRSLVRGDSNVSAEAPIAPLLLSDGNPQRSTPVLHFHSSNMSSGSAGGGEHGSAGGSASSHGKEGGGGKASKKGRRLSASTSAGAALGSEQDGSAGAAPTPLLYATHAEALHGELQRFVQWELEHEWAWRQVPREPVASAAVTLATPRSAAVNGGHRRSISSMPSAGVAKPSRVEKAKMQQLQQQEMEAEEQRLARLAAMPAENIFLTKDELDGFLQFVVEEDLLSHTALHRCTASHTQQPMSTLSRSAGAPVCFAVQVETPMSVLPLREATRLSALQRGGGSVAAFALPATRDDVPGGDATIPGATTPQQSPPLPTTTSGQSKAVGGRSRTSSKRSMKGASKDVAAATAAEASAAAAAPPAPPELALSLTAMEALRAEQAKEAAACQAAYEEELAQAAAHQRAAQHAADINLFFENPRANDAVQAVYASIEDALAARQQRILERVVALERALGLSTPSTGAGRLDSAGADHDDSGAASAAPKHTSSRGASCSGGSSSGKRKAR